MPSLVSHRLTQSGKRIGEVKVEREAIGAVSDSVKFGQLPIGFRHIGQYFVINLDRVSGDVGPHELVGASEQSPEQSGIHILQRFVGSEG
ncbi:hypothetical protein D3C81_1645780 [compost metagenome]